MYVCVCVCAYVWEGGEGGGGGNGLCTISRSRLCTKRSISTARLRKFFDCKIADFRVRACVCVCVCVCVCMCVCVKCLSIVSLCV